MLATHVEKGQRLLGLASMIGDRAEHEFWRLKCRRWSEETRKALASQAGEPAAKAFERVTSEASSENAWFERLAEEVQALREGIALLRSHHERGQRDIA